MRETQPTVHRRIILGSLLIGISTAVAGCSTLGGSGDDDPMTGTGGEIIQHVDVDELDLVIDLERDAVDQLNVIDPAGELFAQKTVEAGIARTTITLGTDYSPGEYEFVGLADGETVEAVSTVLEPELELTDLRLGRDHPEEMYDGADDFETEAEAILSVSNAGTGPTAVTALRFEGDVPLPTHESYDEAEKSGIYDPESDFGADAESITIPAGETILIYSNTGPFSPASTRAKCDSIGQNGKFTVRLSVTHESEELISDSTIHYVDSNSEGCQIDIEVDH